MRGSRRRSLGSVSVPGKPRGACGGRRSCRNLHNLYALYETLGRVRGESAPAPIDLETTETYIVCDVNGRIEKIVLGCRTDAHKLSRKCHAPPPTCARRTSLPAASTRRCTVSTKGPTPGAAGQRAGDAEDASACPEGAAMTAAWPTTLALKKIPPATRRAAFADSAAALDCSKAIYSPHNFRSTSACVRGITRTFTSPITPLSGSAGSPGDQGMPRQRSPTCLS